jgi:hypothetical protein
MGRKLFEKGKIWVGGGDPDMKRLRPAFNRMWNQRFDSFPIKIKFSVASDSLLHLITSLTPDSNG